MNTDIALYYSLKYLKESNMTVSGERHCMKCRQKFYLGDCTVDMLCDDCKNDQVYMTDSLRNLLDTHKKNVRENTQRIRELLNYLHDSVFDQATGDTWKKSYKFIDLIKQAEEELAKLRGW